MIMIWLLAEKTRSQRAKTMMPGEALGGFKALGSSRADRRRNSGLGAHEFDAPRLPVVDLSFVDRRKAAREPGISGSVGGLSYDAVHRLSGLSPWPSEKAGEGTSLERCPRPAERATAVGPSVGLDISTCRSTVCHSRSITLSLRPGGADEFACAKEGLPTIRC